MRLNACHQAECGLADLVARLTLAYPAKTKQEHKP